MKRLSIVGMVVVAFAGVGVWACQSDGSDGSRVPDASLALDSAAQPDGATGDVAAPAVDSGPDAAGPACGANQSSCDGGCIATAEDNANCGGCGVICGAGKTCVDAGCVAPAAADAGTIPCDVNGRTAAGVIVTSTGIYLVGGIPQNSTTPLSSTEVLPRSDAGIDFAGCALAGAVTVPVSEYGWRSTVVASSAYLFGGYTSSSQSNVYRAAITNGVLGAFSVAHVGDGGAAVTLGASRYNAGLFRAGKYVYMLGGFSGAPPTGVDLVSIERVEIDPATGDLVTGFAPAVDPDGGASPTLAVAVGVSSLFAQGPWLYVLGGQTQGGGTNAVVATIQRAHVDSAGNLSSFATVGTLPTPLVGATAFVAGGTLYLLGGATDITGSGYTATNKILQASIGADGSLGAFTTSALTLPYAVVAPNAVQLGSTLYLIEGLGPDGFHATQSVMTFSL